uniref:MARVEL domain-containing protein n=1 Tax=Caenorhabditis tropicalis TaxID=1561998 RepID=A0A1I7TFX3_9PELO
MEIVKTIIPHNNSFVEPPIPSATDWLANMSVMHVSCLTIACVFVSITFVLSFFHLYFVLKYVSNERIRNDMYALIFMFPITTFASLVGMFIPRAAVFLYAVSLVWFVFSQLLALLSMCIAFYGCYVMVPLGREKHSPYRFDFLFRTCDIAQCIYTIQKFVFEFAAAVGLITSDRFLPAAAKALCESS